VFFDLPNYWIFLLALALIYMVIVNFVQSNLGGKGRLRSLQKEMVEVQKKMLEAAKSGRDAEYKEEAEKYNKLTMELVGIQLKMTVVFLALYYPLVAFVFPAAEPGGEDDASVRLYDDGLAAHCDSAAGDGVFSGCYKLPESGIRGAWVVHGYLNASAGELVARQDAAIYYEGGKAEDVWLQSASAYGFLDSFLGKKQYYLNITTEKQEYAAGETVAVFARPMQRVFVSKASLNEMVRSFRENGIALSDNEIAEISNFTRSYAAEKSLAIGGQEYRVKRQGSLFGDEALVLAPSVPQGAIIEAVFNSGTFFHIDLPFALPLLNIRRIIGSTGVFIFFVFVMGLAYSMAKSAYERFQKTRGA